MAKRKNPPDSTGRNIRHGNKRDDIQDERFNAIVDRLHEYDDRIDRLEKKVRKLKKGR